VTSSAPERHDRWPDFLSPDCLISPIGTEPMGVSLRAILQIRFWLCDFRNCVKSMRY